MEDIDACTMVRAVLFRFVLLDGRVGERNVCDYGEAADGIDAEARNEEISRMPSRQNSGIKQ